MLGAASCTGVNLGLSKQIPTIAPFRQTIRAAFADPSGTSTTPNVSGIRSDVWIEIRAPRAEMSIRSHSWLNRSETIQANVLRFIRRSLRVCGFRGTRAAPDLFGAAGIRNCNRRPSSRIIEIVSATKRAGQLYAMIEGSCRSRNVAMKCWR